MNDKPLALGLEAAAALLSVSPRTLRKWASERRIASIKAGRRIVFRVSALEEFLQANERPARGGPGTKENHCDEHNT